MILLCAATQTEFQACRTGLLKSGYGEFFETIKVGMGREAARSGLEIHLNQAKKQRISEIVSTGFAGTRGSLPLGTWIWGQTVAAPGEPLIELTAGQPRFQSKAMSLRAVDVMSLARAGTVAHGLNDIVFDMESYALAQVAAKRGIPFSIVRMVSDNGQFPLPEAIKSLSSGKLEGKLRCAARAFSEPLNLGRFVMKMTGLVRKMRQDWTKLPQLWIEADTA